MEGMKAVGKTVMFGIRGARAGVRGSGRAGRWVTRRVVAVRDRGAAGEVGMIRLLDLHAASCAGDTLITMGLAGTVFFNVSAGEARDRVALYLLLTMAPFALLAPVVGPVLDRFRHGRRYALAATMLGRAFLAWLISDYLGNIGLYPAAFGVLVLSRAYGVARSAAVPRLLPARLGLSEAGARASVFGTLAGAAVAPLGIAAFWLGPQWPLRVATVIFLIGMVVALRLPPRADSDQPERLPRVFALPGRGLKVLSGRLVLSSLFGAAALRALFGFVTLFLAFAIRADQLPTALLGRHLHQTTALGVVAGALGIGSFLAMAVGTRLKIHRPTLLQAGSLALLTAVAVLAAGRYSLATVALFCLFVAATSGLAKLALDATIQERLPETVRASAFAHSETALMLAWVIGGAVGLIPFTGRVGILIAAGAVALSAARATVLAGAMRKERLVGAASPEARAEAPTEVLAAPQPRRGGRPPRAGRSRARRGQTAPDRSAGDPATGEVPAPTESTGTQPVPRDDAAAPGPPAPGEQSEPRLTRTMQRQPESPGYHLYQPTRERLVHPDEEDG
jgi:MFS family permease